MEIDMTVGILALLTIVASGGVAWGSVRTVVNRFAELQTSFLAHEAKDNAAQLDTVGRLGSIEGKLDLVLNDKIKITRE